MLTQTNLIEAVAILAVIAIMLACAGAIVANWMRQWGSRDFDGEQ